jgi:hypothetical protein
VCGQNRLVDVYRHLAATWPFQVRRRDLGALLPRLEAAEQEIAQAGPAGQRAQEVALRELKTSIGEIQWEKMSRKWRAVAWGRLCSTFVKRLEPLLAERARIARSEELAAGKLERIRLAREEQKARKRAYKMIEFWRRNPRTRQLRKVAPPLQIRRVRVLAGPRLRRVPVATSPSTSTYLTADDKQLRHLRHIRAQRRRSQRRAHLLSIRMEWARKMDEETAASADLWQFAREDDGSRRPGRDLSAWPRLAQREREQLAQEVEEFVKVSR